MLKLTCVADERVQYVAGAVHVVFHHGNSLLQRTVAQKNPVLDAVFQLFGKTSLISKKC